MPLIDGEIGQVTSEALSYRPPVKVLGRETTSRLLVHIILEEGKEKIFIHRFYI